MPDTRLTRWSSIVWVVTVGDTERNFPRKRDAVAWLIRLTHDTRPSPPVHKETRERYRYYGPGDDLRFVAIAVIDRLSFPPRSFYKPRRPRRKNEPEEPKSAEAGDPQ